MKKIILFFTLLTSITYFSCSKDEGGSQETLTITADYTSRYVNENITYTVINQNGDDITSESTILVNNIAITGYVHTSSIIGNFIVKAQKNNTFSPPINITFNLAPIPLTSITTTSNSLNVDKGTTLSFTSTGNNGANLTANSIFFVDGVQLSGNTHLANTAGTLNVYSTHLTTSGSSFISPTIQIVVNEIINFNKRVLIEDYTGTWCQYCPRVSYAVELVEAQTNDAVVVALHGGSSDPFRFTGTLPQSISGYPTAMLNRTTEWSYPETSYTSQAVNLTTGVNPKIGLALVTSTTGNTSNVEVKVKFGATFSNLKLVVYAVEDGLLYNQTNSTSFYGGVNPIVNFEHNGVLRSVLSSSILGEAITGNTSYNDEFTKSFTYTIPSNVNSTNLHFVAVVVDLNRKALNSRGVSATETQTFEIE